MCITEKGSNRMDLTTIAIAGIITGSLFLMSEGLKVLLRARKPQR